MEDALVAERFQIELHRFRFDDELVCGVDDLDIRKIRLMRERTDTGELRTMQRHFDFSGGVIRKYFQAARGGSFVPELRQCFEVFLLGRHIRSGAMRMAGV